MSEPIYLDYQATTPIDPQVYAAMEPWLRDKLGNPHSAHKLGREAAATVELARDHLAALMPAGGKVIFTSGASEAINLAVYSCTGRDGDFAASAIEHAAVHDAMAGHGRDKALHMLNVKADGVTDMVAAQADMPQHLALAAVMLVNNEIGTIQPVAQLADMAHRRGGLFLCDAVQGYGRVTIPDNVDFVAISAHKIHGPKGIGALWVRDGITLRPLIYGGGQEQGVRSGTLSPALCAGMGMAAKIAKERAQQDAAHVAALAEVARKAFADWHINGSTEQRYAGNVNIWRDGVDSAHLLSTVRNVAFSAGSACASGSGRPSHVLKALGLSKEALTSSIRLGFGRFTSENDIVQAANHINAAAKG